jgi:capsular polysaccharide biosynthesis protein
MMNRTGLAEEEAPGTVPGTPSHEADRNGHGRTAPARNSSAGSGLPLSLIGLAIAVVLISTLTAYWVGGRGTSVYAADAEVVLDLGAVNDSMQAQRMLTTETVIIEGHGVLAPASDELGMDQSDLEESIDASVVTGSQIIRVRATSEDPERAEEIATSVLDAYLGSPRSTDVAEARSFLEEELETVSAAQAQLLAQIDQLRAAATPPNPAEERGLLEQSQSNIQRISTLQSELLRLQLRELEVGRPRLIAEPQALQDPIAPTPTRTAALGLLAGLVLATGILVMGLRARSDRDDP